MRLTKFIFVALLLCNFQYALSADIYSFKHISDKDYLGNYMEIMEDPTGKLSLEEVLESDDFKDAEMRVPFLGISQSNWWIKVRIKNSTDQSALFLTLDQPTLDYVDFYTLHPDGTSEHIEFGEIYPFKERTIQHQQYIFELNIPQGETQEYIIRLKSGEQILVPLQISTREKMTEGLLSKDLFFGIYIGIILIMMAYNLFIFFTIRDRAYIWYVIYIALVGFTQTALNGYTYRLLWPENTWLAEQSVFLFPALVGAAGIWFMKVFLHTKEFTPKLDKLIYVFVAISFANIFLAFIGMHNLAQQLIQINAMLISFFMIFLSLLISRRGYRPARFFFYAWAIFLIGVFIFVLRDVGVLPYNWITTYTMPVGSAIEVGMLSLALADKINILKKEKEESQAESLRVSLENERIIREQNVILEKRVNERTKELQESNDELNQTYNDLKQTQSKLVESEKMASLGQLTAGIAHEINNPINFVTANVEPLKRDIADLLELIDNYQNLDPEKDVTPQLEKIQALAKELDIDFLKIEVDELIAGIGEGASRTAEIVKGLRNFSRLDEGDLKYVNINEGINSTITIIDNELNEHGIIIDRQLGELDAIECYPGKLNQLFMNLLTNSIQAIKQSNRNDGKIIIQSKQHEDYVQVEFTDNGSGMSEETKNKIFEPFFTTKDVGEGTGLGLSIGYSIVELHNGNIEVSSKLGEGTTFILKIPLKQS